METEEEKKDSPTNRESLTWCLVVAVERIVSVKNHMKFFFIYHHHHHSIWMVDPEDFFFCIFHQPKQQQQHLFDLLLS